MSEEAAPVVQLHDDDLLWRHLKTVPAPRALLGAVEARFFRGISLPEPVLEVGSSDGLFAFNTFAQPLTAAVYHNNVAQKTAYGVTHNLTTTATDSDLPFPAAHFASAFSHSLPEQDDVLSVLTEINRVLQENGRFIFTCPSYRFDQNDLLENLNAPERWAALLAETGFVIDRWQYFISETTAQTLEREQWLSFPSHILHALTGHWIIAPWESSLKPTERRLRPYYNEPFPTKGAYLLFVVRKASDQPQTVQLPPPRPFTQEELQPTARPQLVEPEETATAAELSAGLTPALPIVAPQPIPESQETIIRRTNRRPIIAAGLILAALFFALIGQSQLRSDPDMPVAGLRWFAYSGIALLLLFWQRRSAKRDGRSWQLPRWKAIPRRRWLYLLALLCILVTQRLVSTGGEQRPLAAILIWLFAIALAFYALNNPLPATAHGAWRLSRFTVLTSLLLFFSALLLRLFQIGDHPFILTGVEADIGLNALSVAGGFIRNPFGTAWLTNPTLPLYLLAAPLKLLGPSTAIIRLPSAFIGALTVTTTFLIGQRLWGRAVGLAGAILLLGSHFHLHYSRLGITNVWDALFMLLALGLLGIAWQQKVTLKRVIWLATGVAIGLNAYLFSSSRLLPVVLFVLLVLSVLFERDQVRKQWRGGLFAALMALVVALPQILYYRANPGIFMERVNLLGILDGQSGWLSAEAARLGFDNTAVWWPQFWKAALAFNATVDQSTFYGPPGPLLGFISGILFVLGLLIALFHLRQLRYNLLSVWVLATIILGGALLQNPPASHRLIIAAPALSLLSAMALVQIVAVIAEAFDKDEDEEEDTAVTTTPFVNTFSKAGLIVVVVAALLLALQDIGTYFGTYRSHPRFADRNTEIADNMAHYLNDLEGDWTAYFYGPPSMYVNFPTIPFLAPDFEKGINLFDVEEPGSQPETPNGVHAVHIYLPERQDELTAVQTRFPQGNLRTFEGYYATPLFFAYEVKE